MLKYQDLTGRKFGRLSVIKMIRREEMKRPIFWECVCDCGKTTISANQDVVKGKIKWCKEFLKEYGITSLD